MCVCGSQTVYGCTYYRKRDRLPPIDDAEAVLRELVWAFCDGGRYKETVYFWEEGLWSADLMWAAKNRPSLALAELLDRLDECARTMEEAGGRNQRSRRQVEAVVCASSALGIAAVVIDRGTPPVRSRGRRGEVSSMLHRDESGGER